MKNLQLILLNLLFLVYGNYFAQYYVGGYIRQSFYETDQVGVKTMLANNDLMYLGFNPYADGQLFFELPVNDATFGAGVSYVPSISGRNGVMKFSGAPGAVMDGQKDLLILPTGGAKVFTFASWVYNNADANYVPNQFIFKKYDGSNEISLRFGAVVGELIFKIATASNVYEYTASPAETGITGNNWNHIAISLNLGAAAGSQLKLYVDGVAKNFSSTPSFPANLPTIRTNFYLGENFNGYLDEPLVNTLVLGSADIANIKNGIYNFKTWNFTKTVAFWNFDDASNPGKDLRTYVRILDDIKEKIASKDIKLRITVSGGSWQTAVSTAAGRSALANALNKVVTDNNLDGVDVDLEWPSGNSEAAFSNYSAFVLALRSAIGDAKTLSISLHPYYYKVGAAAIAASDYVALQAYGPQKTLWPYDQFVAAATAALNYGIPKNKLVMGVPFYGTNGTAGGQTAYKNIVAANPGMSFDIDEASYNNIVYTFNGVTTITKKGTYVRENSLAGVMSWDLAIDMTDYDHPYSLMNALIRSLGMGNLSVKDQSEIKINIYSQNGVHIVDSPSKIDEIKIFDLSGRLLKVIKPNASRFEIQLPSQQVSVLSVKTNDKYSVFKVRN